MEVMLLPSCVASPKAWAISSLEGYMLLFPRGSFMIRTFQAIKASQ